MLEPTTPGAEGGAGALAKLAEIPPAGSEEHDFWLEAAEQHGFEAWRGAFFASAQAILGLMSASRKQGQRDALAATPHPGSGREPSGDVGAGSHLLLTGENQDRLIITDPGSVRDNGADLAGLSDPIAVHANMLHGAIAKPSVANIIHLYGREALLAALVPTTSVPPDLAGREVIARIIDPSAADWQAASARDDSSWDCGFSRRWDEATAKADAILALTSPRSVAPSGETRGVGQTGRDPSGSGHSRAEPFGLGPQAECPSRGPLDWTLSQEAQDHIRNIELATVRPGDPRLSQTLIGPAGPAAGMDGYGSQARPLVPASCDGSGEAGETGTGSTEGNSAVGWQAETPLERIRHVKSGGIYEVLCTDAQIQTDTPLGDYAKVSVYRGVEPPHLTWVRPVAEMEDGRFEPAPPPPVSQTEGERP